VRIIRPIVSRRFIVRTDGATGELLSRRKSPKSEEFWDLFKELVRTPLIVGRDTITFEVLSVEVTEHRVTLSEPVRRGRFFRGFRTENRSLDRILESRQIAGRTQWLDLIPPALTQPWTSENLGQALGIDARKARWVLYTFTRAGLLSAAREGSRRLSYRKSPPSAAIPAAPVDAPVAGSDTPA
jgi:hypothetical protein